MKAIKNNYFANIDNATSLKDFTHKPFLVEVDYESHDARFVDQLKKLLEVNDLDDFQEVVDGERMGKINSLVVDAIINDPEYSTCEVATRVREVESMEELHRIYDADNASHWSLSTGSFSARFHHIYGIAWYNVTDYDGEEVWEQLDLVGHPEWDFGADFMEDHKDLMDEIR